MMKHLTGLTAAEVEMSRQTHGQNLLTPGKRDPLWKQFIEKFEDPMIRILMIAAAIAIAVGIYDGSYIEGLGILFAIILATTVAFINEYKANQEFDILNQVSDEVPIKVIRDDSYTTIPKKDLVVGDIVLIELGEEIPADGEVLDAVSLKIDEASLTGESIPVSKWAEIPSNLSHDSAYGANQLLRGTIVSDGHGTMKVTAVGDRTEIGQTARSILDITEVETPLNQQLDRLSRLIGVFGLGIAVLIDIALVGRGIVTQTLDLSAGQWYFISFLILGLLIAILQVWLPIIYDGLELGGVEIELPGWLEQQHWRDRIKTTLIGLVTFGVGIGVGYWGGWIPSDPHQWLPAAAAGEFLTYFMIAVAVIVVAVPEGLALSVTLSLAYSMAKMTQQNNLVRRMHACETIGAATVICSDKTGTLTLNQMQVTEAYFPSLQPQNLPQTPLLLEAMAVNSTANLERHAAASPRPIGNPTEGALLLWLDQYQIDYLQIRKQFQVTHQLAFTSDRKYMSTLGISANRHQQFLHIKGAPDILLEHCSQILTADGIQPLTKQKQKFINQELKNCDANGLRSLGFAYIPQPQQQEMALEDHEDLTWLGFVAITDPVRPEVPEAVKRCQSAGISVKMITGDSLLTAVQIASQIGIITETDTAAAFIRGKKLRQMDDETATAALKQIKVIARARPQDKQRIVRLLQEQGEVVAVTGDGTNDAAALNQAQVGIAMGSGTFVTKEASDIILLDNSFASLEKAVLWGRSLYQNIQKFILFQLTINVAACALALLGPFIGIDLPFTVTQLLWVNLIMDTFAALALATEPPSETVMTVPPRRSDAFIISKPMATQILTMASLFLVLMVIFLLVIQQDQAITDYELSLFFSTFVMLQFWNLFNAKCFGRPQSVLTHLFDNWSFIAIAALIFIGQIAIVQWGGSFFRTVPLSLSDWLIIISSTSLVLALGELQRGFSNWTANKGNTSAQNTQHFAS
ncbi:MAG: calcium-translocating P-type ATPase, PMCA-type [Microcoleaceae cyanobacterium]